LELAYFASGIVIAIVAMVGLWQLKLAKDALSAARQQIELATTALQVAKDDIKIRSLREAISLAAGRSEQFAEKIIPHYDRVAALLEKNGAELLEWKLANSQFTLTSLNSKESKRWLDTLGRSDESCGAASSLLNELEAFAIYFVNGAADERGLPIPCWAHRSVQLFENFPLYSLV
jgi:hypothetical protein